MTSTIRNIPSFEAQKRRPSLRRHMRWIVPGCAVLVLLISGVLTVLSGWIAPFDPLEMHPLDRFMQPSDLYLLGTDNFGRDTFSRILHGGRVSLSVAFLVAVSTTVLGVSLGVMAGYVRWLDGILMRIMDGLMAIPGILLAIALMTVMEASLLTVVFAITITEVPRMTRLARAATLGVRNMLYIEAAVTIGTRFIPLLWRHIIPNIAAPLLVQATFVAASAILLEAYLGFLGAGIPPEVPSWGNMIAQGRTFVQVSFGLVLYPSLVLAAVVLSINILGDFLRDVLDPRMARRI